MSRSKKLCILLGVLAVVCLATFGALQLEEYQEKIQNSDEIILEIPVDTVTALSWVYQDTSLAFHKEDAWLYDGDEAFPVDEEILEGFLERFESFGVAFVIEEVEDESLYGLDAPVCTITLKTENETYEVKLGDYSKMDSQRYVSIGDGKVYLVKSDPLEDFDAELKDMIRHDQIPDFGQVTGLSFSSAEYDSVFYEKDSVYTHREEDVYFIERNGKQLPLDTDRVNSYVEKLQDLGLKSYVTYNATAEELEKYGLDQPELSVTVIYQPKADEEEQKTFVLHLSRDPEEMRAAEEAGKEDESGITAYARVGDSPIVYQIYSGSYPGLLAGTYEDLRHREVLGADFETVRQLEFDLEGKTYTVTSEEKDGERIWSYGDEEIDMESLQNAIEAIKASSSEDFTNEAPAEKEEIGLTVFLDDEEGTTLRIDLYRYDGSQCLAVTDGTSMALVPRSCVVDLMEAVRAIVLQ